MPLINFAGLASGIDSNALIDATLTAQRKQKVQPKKDKITELTDANKAFDDLTTKLKDLQTASRSWSTLNGGGVAKVAASNNETGVTATAANGATNGSYTLSVTQLAKASSYSFNNNYTSASDTVANLGATDTITFQIGNSSTETVDIDVTPTMTVSDFVAAFNAESNRAEASLVQVGAGQYRIAITSTKTGTDEGAIVSVTRGAGFSGSKLDPGDVTHDPAQNAQFTVNGIGATITRQTNKVNDVITGVTFNLLSAPSSATVTISDDPNSTVTTVKKWIDSYNAIITFITENNQITREENGADVKNVFGPLASSRTDNSALASIRDAMAGLSYSGGSTVRILADLGITTERDGTLKFDETKFKNSLSSEPTSVNEVMKLVGDRLAPTGAVIDVIIRFNGSIDTSIRSNKDLISSLNDQIAQAEAALARTEESMRAQFARLESIVGRLQQQQQSLTSALAGLG